MLSAHRNIGVLHTPAQKGWWLEGAPSFAGKGHVWGSLPAKHHGKHPDLLCREPSLLRLQTKCVYDSTCVLTNYVTFILGASEKKYGHLPHLSRRRWGVP